MRVLLALLLIVAAVVSCSALQTKVEATTQHYQERIDAAVEAMSS